MTRYALSRILPFALFMAFIGGEEFLRFLIGKGMVNTPQTTFLFLYPFRAVTVGLVLILLQKEYEEINPHDLFRFRDTLLSIGTGIVVFILWINMSWTFGAAGPPIGYDPTVVSENFTRNFLIGTRLMGAAVVVPIMEELFWRSFLLRYIINPDIERVSIGRFSWGSFLIGSVLFGLEHHYIIAGIMAGAAYSLLLYRTRSLLQCILAHAITNFALGVYVLQTARWEFW